MSVHPVNLLWQKRARGALPFVANSLADDGSAVVIRPDEFETRTYQVLRALPDGQAEEVIALSVETVRKFEIGPGPEAMVGETDDDVYLFREGRKTRFLADRRVTYSDVALSRQGSLLVCGFADMMFASHTVALGDMGGRLGWTKDLEAPVTRLAISADGRTLALGRADGVVMALDQMRNLLWEFIQEEPITGLALGLAGQPCAVGTDAGTVLLLDREGGLAWRASVGRPVLTLAASGAAEWVAVAAGDDAGHALACFSANGSLVWEHELDARPTGLALSPNGHFLGISLSDGRLLLFQADFAATLGGAGTRDRALEEVDTLLREGDVSGARDRVLRLLETHPSYLPAADRLSGIEAGLVEARLARAAAQRAAGDFPGAFALLDETNRLLPHNRQLFEARCAFREAAAAACLEQAEAHVQAGQLEAAQSGLSELLRLDPGHRSARERLFEVHTRMADLLTAEGDQRAVEGDHGGALERWQRAAALGDHPELQERIRQAEFRRAIQAGIVLYNQQRLPEASFQFRKALSLDPASEEAQRYLQYTQGGGPDTTLKGRFSHLE